MMMEDTRTFPAVRERFAQQHVSPVSKLYLGSLRIALDLIVRVV